ncbi:hypothetical protein FO519_010033, partial [Halicephalobus sp. NKZ332]
MENKPQDEKDLVEMKMEKILDQWEHLEKYKNSTTMEKIRKVYNNCKHEMDKSDAVNETIEIFMLSSLEKSLLDDFNDCIHVIEKYVPHVATVLYRSAYEKEKIKAARVKLVQNFELLVKEIEKIVLEYIEDGDEKTLVKKRLQKMELKADEPEWLQLEDSVYRFENEHKDLHINKDSITIDALIQLRKFAFNRSISHINDKKGASRNSVFESSTMSERTIGYSNIGNWMQIPMASFLDVDEKLLMIRVAQKVAKILDSEGLKWSPFGNRKAEAEYNNRKFNLRGILGQEQCFRAHGLKEEDFSLAVGLEAAYNVLLNDIKNPEEKNKLALDLARMVAKDDF